MVLHEHAPAVPKFHVHHLPKNDRCTANQSHVYYAESWLAQIVPRCCMFTMARMLQHCWKNDHFPLPTLACVLFVLTPATPAHPH